MAEETQEKTPRDLLRAVFRHRLLFLMSAAFFTFAALVGACWWPLKYTATGEFERRADPVSEDLVRGKSISFDALKMTLRQELAGANAVEEAVDDLEKKGLLLAMPRSQDGRLTSEGKMLRQERVRRLMDDLKVEFEVSSQEVDLVSITFTDPDPQLAQQLPNTLITNYINRISEQLVTNLTASRDFLQSKVGEVNMRFVELTRKRIDFETKYAGMLPDSPGTLQQEIQQIATDVNVVRRQQALAKQRLEQVNIILGLGRSPAPPGDGAPPKDKPEPKPEGNDAAPAGAAEKAPEPSALSVEQEYKDATQELARLQDQQQQYQRSLDEGRNLAHMTEKHPTIIALRKQIENLDKRIATAKGRVSDLEKRFKESQPLAIQPPLSSDASGDLVRQRDTQMHQARLVMEASTAQAEYQMATNEIERLEARQAELQKVMANYGPVRQEYLGILKEVADQQAEVERWQRRLNEVQMALAAEAAKHRTHLNQVTLAQEQFSPSSPKLLYVLALALVGGLAFGGGLVFLTNVVDRSITTTEEAASHFGLPVLGTIGEITTASQRARRKMLRWGLGPVLALMVVLAIGAAALNITLWLTHREQYDKWKESPVRFVMTKIGESLSNRL